VPADPVEAALRLVQGSVRPTGVGARNLAECIALQAIEADRYDPCMARLIDHLDLVARGEVARLKRLCAVDDEDFAEMLAELRSYDPRPGLRFAGGDGAAVTPDILVTAGPDGGWSIALNPATLPRLVVNRDYYRELRGTCADKASSGWLAERPRRRQLADPLARPAAEDDPQGHRGDRPPPGRLLPPRRRPAAPADPARGGRGDRDARIHRSAG
jgi:RNA polymerase sigma-54 factor